MGSEDESGGRGDCGEDGVEMGGGRGCERGEGRSIADLLRTWKLLDDELMGSLLCPN